MLMERAQQPASLADPAYPATTEKAPVSLVQVAPPGGRWALASFIAQLALLAMGLAAGLMIGRRLESNQQGLEQQRIQSDVTRQKVDALAEQTALLRAEMMNLRQTVASNTSEDVLFLKVLLLKPSIDPELARQVAILVHKNAQQYSRDPNLVLAIITEESGFNPRAVSPVGAAGLMQVMPHWKRVLAINGDLYDPDTNIKYGLQVLGFYLEMYQDLEMALTAYNRGPGPVDAALVRGKNPNNGYAPKVLGTYERLKRLNVSAMK
jgi:soluble lytic murein transglycosylase-like protein